MTDLTHAAVALAATLYEAFMTEVVEPHVIPDRAGRLPDDKKRQAQEAGRLVDTRSPRLMTLSGKGGYHADPIRRASYALSANVTLLDHLLSVVRGALTFAALDLLAANPTADREVLGEICAGWPPSPSCTTWTRNWAWPATKPCLWKPLPSAGCAMVWTSLRRLPPSDWSRTKSAI